MTAPEAVVLMKWLHGANKWQTLEHDQASKRSHRPMRDANISGAGSGVPMSTWEFASPRPDQPRSCRINIVKLRRCFGAYVRRMLLQVL